MTPAHEAPSELRVLILAPTGRDAQLTETILRRAGIATQICADAVTMCREAGAGAGSLLIAEEATTAARERLTALLALQPSWSDLPVLVLTGAGANSPNARLAQEKLGNVTLLERPVRLATLVSAVRVALRARERQYELRDRFASQALLAAIVESSDDAIIGKTVTGVILSWNHGAERMFGYTADEAVGRPITMIIPPERHAEERTILDRILRGERVVHFETVRVTKDGRMIDVSLTISPVRDANGVIIGASKVGRDITLQKRSELALREADQRKDEFLAMLAHELRNPLAPMRNALALLEPLGRSNTNVEHLRGMMERQVDLMVRLVDDLMEVSRITRGKIELRKQRVNLADLIHAAIETSQPLIVESQLELKLDMPEEPIMVDADPVRLTQVFANLLNNAARYGEGAGEVRLAVHREDPEVVVSVRDFGIGLPPDMLTQVFEMFTQIQWDHRGRQTGLGIGLTLVRGLVHLHGGSVTAFSEGPGTGSEFTVRLPMAEGQVHRQVPPRKRLAPLSSPMRVLVVDDNRDAADSMGMLLERLGAQVDVVYDGGEALRALERSRPAVVLLDLRMPDVDGFAVARRIRERPEFRDLPLVALSGWGQEEDRQRSQTAGFDHHLVKPTSIDTLRVVLEGASARTATVSARPRAPHGQP